MSNKKRPRRRRSDVKTAETDVFCVPEGTETLEASMFSGRRPRVVTLPETLRVIGMHAFAECAELEEIVIPAGVERIEYDAFMHCTSLRRVLFEEDAGLTEIKAKAFFGCTALSEFGISPAAGELILPETVIKVGNETFFGCSSLETAVLGRNLERVGMDAFAGCTSLTVLRGGGPGTHYGLGLVMGCPAELQLDLAGSPDTVMPGHLGVPDAGGFIIDDGVLYGYVGKDEVIRVPEGVEAVRRGAFRGLKGRGEVAIEFPDTLEVIEDSADLMRANVKFTLPPGFLAVSPPIDRNIARKVKRRAAVRRSPEQVAALYLFHLESDPWPERQMRKAGSYEPFAQAMGPLLKQRKSYRMDAPERAGLFFTLHAEEISGESKDAMETVLTGGPPAGGAKLPYRESFLDGVLRLCELDPKDPSFRAVRRADGKGKATPLAVKSAVVPYIAQAAAFTEADYADLAARLMPPADTAAAGLERESLAAALGDLHVRDPENVPLAFAYARYAMNDQLGALLEMSGASIWQEAAGSYFIRQAVRAGVLLNPGSAAAAFVLGAPRWTELRKLYADLHPGRALIMPEDPNGLLGDGAAFASGSVSFTVRLGRRLAPEICDNNSRRKWLRLPRKLELPARSRKALERLVAAAQESGDFLRMQVDDTLFDHYLSGEVLDAAWLEGILQHPVVRRVLDGIIFEQDGETFLLEDGVRRSVHGETAPPGDLTAVRVAHVLDMDGTAAQAWRDSVKAGSSWMQQLEEPRYTAEDIADKRYRDLSVSLQTISNERSRDFMFSAMHELLQGRPGISLHMVRGRYRSDFELDDIHVTSVDRWANRVLFHLDQMTALARARAGDATVLPFYALAGGARVNNALRETVRLGHTELTAALLALKDGSRSSATGDLKL